MLAETVNYMVEPLSDFHKVLASNQYALPVVTYPMWTLTWPLANLQQLDREARKIIKENGGYHPLGSTELLYLPRKCGGRGLKSFESLYKQTKVKTTMKLYANEDRTMSLVREFEEKCERAGRRSLVKDAKKFALEMDITLDLAYPDPKALQTDSGEKSHVKGVGRTLRAREEERSMREVREQRWHGKLFGERWNDNKVIDCFTWLSKWKSAPVHTVAGIYELYQQLLPTKLYHQSKTKTLTTSDITCRMCGKGPESMAHVISGCGALAQTKYMQRHNAALKILFFEFLKDLDLIQCIPPWYSPVSPKPEYKNDRACAYWDVPVFAENTEVRANRIDARIVDRKEKKVILIEMSCPWVSNREQKEQEKTDKYAPLRWEMRQQFPGHTITQFNVIVDVLGGYSMGTAEKVRKFLGLDRGNQVLFNMQKAVLSYTLNIARSFKVSTGY